MKKFLLTIISAILLLILVGCSSTIKGSPKREFADSVIYKDYSDVFFMEMVRSEDRELYSFYYEGKDEYKGVNSPVKTSRRTYVVESYYDYKSKQWKYSPAKEIDRYYEWDIEGTWYPVINEYRTWYASCVMTIGKIENDQVHISFEKDGIKCFDETIPFNNESGASFTVHTTNSIWEDIDMSISPEGIGADSCGTRSGCDFERVGKPDSTETNN